MRPDLPGIEAIRHVHLIAVAGTGMGSLACMLADRGFHVTGSDLDTYPPMSDQLRKSGIRVAKGFAANHVVRDRPDLVVIGNAVRRDNPEARATLESGLPYVSFPDAVQHFFLRGKHSVAIAGTHGKTTCTSQVGWILAHAGADPSVLVGRRLVESLPERERLFGQRRILFANRGLESGVLPTENRVHEREA